MRDRRLSSLAASAGLLVAGVVLVAALAGGCASMGVGGGFNLISVDDEWRMRDDLRRQVESQKRVVRDPAANAYLTRIGRQLVAQSPLASRPWDFRIVDDPTLNAFNLPGGLVYVHTGLIREAETLDQLTGVLAHEIGHGVARHGTQLMTRAYGLETIAAIVLGKDPSQSEQLLARVVGTGVLNDNSREFEREADTHAVRATHAAGFDPEGISAFFRKLEQRRRREPSKVEQFFSSHPMGAERIRDTEALIAELPSRGGLIGDSREYQSFRSRFR
jgi:predicted Zn-dependent protease